jgi:hypothetical protein
MVMKIAISTVTLDGYNDARNTPLDPEVISDVLNHRLAVYEQALKSAEAAAVDLLCLPGGYFFILPEVSSEIKEPCADKNLKALEIQIVQLAKKYQVGIAVGIDLSPKNLLRDHTACVRAGMLSWCSFSWSPSENIFHCWNQRSTTNADQRDCPDELCLRVQNVNINEQKIEILTCGELFNQRIRAAIVCRSNKPIAIIDLAHTLAGFRATSALEDFSREGLHAFCTGHAKKSGAMKYYYAPVALNKSSRDVDFETDNNLRPYLQAKVWSI